MWLMTWPLTLEIGYGRATGAGGQDGCGDNSGKTDYDR